MDALYAQFVASGPVIGKSVSPINDKPVYIDPSLAYDFIAVTEVGNYHVIFLLQRKYFDTSILLWFINFSGFNANNFCEKTDLVFVEVFLSLFFER